ncbi:uncharacterized protein LOC124358861 [Homalodisca vitripennis]|uniref:uncharacterized protein LOC124358861 n=1 Tax=Homalodisca vitripennis TaxID=197043 RepID=UPI001EE9F74C|nr:uncharacterized protein LOC124358861 [Homalodisca vitripennis]
MDPNEDKTPSSELSDRSRLTDPGPPPILPPKPRPQISLKIPLQPTGSIPLQTSPPRPMSFYYDPRMVAIPMTPVGNHNSNHNSNEIPAIPIPLGLMQAYPNKASEFMFKQFEGFRDFTMNTAKSGLSVGEKFSFWAYNKLRAWSRKWFTHFFLLLVIALYSLAGAAIFVAVEGSEEKKAVAEIRKEREIVIRNIVQLVKQFGLSESDQDDEDLMGRALVKQFGPSESEQDDEDLMGRAVQEMRVFERHIIEHFKEGHIDKDDKPLWNFWSAVFYCGTVFTTIAHSPDLTTPDAYVWGMLKENIFRKAPPSTIVQLKEK